MVTRLATSPHLMRQGWGAFPASLPAAAILRWKNPNRRLVAWPGGVLHVRWPENPDAQPCGDIARPGRPSLRGADPARDSRHTIGGSLPTGARNRVLRPWMFLGSRAALLAEARCVVDRSRLRGRHHRQPDL